MAQGAINDFCGSDFWDSNLTWYTDNPQFTPCFEKTVFTSVPSIFLVTFLPFDIHFSVNSKARNIPWNWRSILKIVICTFSILSCVVDFIITSKYSFSENAVFPVDFFAPALRAFGLVVCIVLILYHRSRGVRTSGLLFLFWFLVVLLGAPQITSIFRSSSEEEYNPHDVGFMVYYFTSVAVFILHFIADVDPLETDYVKAEYPCPEVSASFFSQLTFSWFDGLAMLGYRRPLINSDLWSLNYQYKSAHIFPTFNKHWETTLRKDARKRASEQGAAYDKKQDGVPLTGIGNKKQASPSSIIPALCKTFGLTFAFVSSLKLCQDLLSFANPQFLDLLIQFVKGDEPSWRGFFYAGLLFGTATIQTLVNAQYLNRMLLIGLQVRTSMISTIYRKSLRLSNAARKKTTVGEIVNLMSVDAQRFTDFTTHLNMMWSAPLQISLALYFLWQLLGPSVLAGLAVMLIMIPLNGFVASKMKNLQVRQMKYKDERIKMMNEILSGIKVLKLYAWEPSFEEQISKIRNKEIQVLKENAYLNAATSFLWSCAPFLVSLVTFAVYVLVDENNILNARTAFVSLSLFNLLRFPLSMLPMMITKLIQTAVSIKRINRFLNNEELDPDAVFHDEREDDQIAIDNGSFKWDIEESLTLKNINLRIKPKSLVAVVGVVGSGKSSLLSALLGEMEKVSGRVNVKGKVAYVPQTAWIQNATLQNNILFGQPLHKKNYLRVVEACALKPDLEMLPGGDQTEIGEKGINLSGGQRQRVSLARAVYYDSDVYYLDDPLSAVDSHVGKHIFDNVIGPNGLLHNKTRILVTHSITYLHAVDYVIVLKDGAISEMGTYKELVDKKGDFAEFLSTHLQEVEKEELDELGDDAKTTIRDGSPKELIRKLSTNSKKSSYSLSRENSVGSQRSIYELNQKNKGKDKLIEEEKAETGRVKMSVYKHYLSAIGPFFVSATILLNIAFQGFSVGSNLWLSRWSSDQTMSVNGTADTSKRDVYLEVYGLLGIGQILSVLVATIAVYLGTLKSALILHRVLLNGILRVQMSFFDVTPLGRIVNRFSKDVDTLDNVLPMLLKGWIGCLFPVIAVLFVISYSTPTFVVIVIPVGLVYYFVQRFYVATSRQLKRLESVSRSPIYSHFGESVQGSSVVRAYNVQERFIYESEEKVDFNQVCTYPGMMSNRWLAVRLEMLGSLIIFSSAILAVYGKGTMTAGLVGLSVSYALQITQSLNWLVRMTADVETNIVSVERIKEYSEIPHEAPWEVTPNIVRNDWPTQGSVEFKGYEVRYRSGLDLVLKGLTFSIKGGEKVGIVGRTGAGKSSMTLSLFRIIEAAGGYITIDGVDISKLGLHALRSRLTIIPQDPVLFSGTLRMNLDPFETHTDEQIWKALELAHLKTFVSGLPSRLQHQTTEGGDNLSLGQRQLICLARALLRKTKVLVLDEATAAVDLETDDFIQKTIRSEFTSCTILTIAHRINTIMDSDRVLVLDKGTLVEFDSPSALLKRKGSIFYSMAKDAGITS